MKWERSVGDIKIIPVLNSVPDTEELIIRKIYSSFSPLGNKNDWIIVENPELKIMQLKDLVWRKKGNKICTIGLLLHLENMSFVCSSVEVRTELMMIIIISQYDYNLHVCLNHHLHHLLIDWHGGVTKLSYGLSSEFSQEIIMWGRQVLSMSPTTLRLSEKGRILVGREVPAAWCVITLYGNNAM